MQPIISTNYAIHKVPSCLSFVVFYILYFCCIGCEHGNIIKAIVILYISVALSLMRQFKRGSRSNLEVKALSL